MQRFWSLLFLLVTLFCVGITLFCACSSRQLWLPEMVSSYGGRIDGLFRGILAITTVAFLGTELTLVYALYRYTGTGRRSTFIHTDHRLELGWTIVPAVILLGIAVVQFNTWTDIKMQGKFPKQQPDAEVLAGQFEWRIRYAGTDGIVGTEDDLVMLNELHAPVDEPFLFQLRSRDVLHSFFLPNLRVKQDAVPGMLIPVWFQPTKIGEFELTCAELCGWGHFKMRGKLVVQSKDDYKKWLETKLAEQNETGFNQGVSP